MSNALNFAGVDRPYWEALAQGRVDLPRCGSCERWLWPAVARCGTCGSWSIAWQTVEPRGKVFSWTRTWHAFVGTESLPVPFVSVIVELHEAGGIRLLGLMEKEDESACAVGLLVTGRISERSFAGGIVPVLRWRPESRV
jgi:uncharacterized protein